MFCSLDSHRYVGSIFISKIVISGFCECHINFTVTSSLYREYRYIEDRPIGVALLLITRKINKLQFVP